MTDTAIDNQQIVDQVVAALTGIDPELGEAADIAPQMQRASEDVDRRTAHTFGAALLASLCEDPQNVRQLEALLILGLAHPSVLKDNQISLAVEGRRLAVLLERSGELDRARGLLELLSAQLPDERAIDHELAGLLRRSGNTEDLVARYIQRAEECAAEGAISEAIPWLQEVLLIDRGRRDVARMIRDLRYQEADVKTRKRRRTRMLLIMGVISTLSTLFLAREHRIRADFNEIPAVDMEAFPRSLYSRHEAVGDLLEGNLAWLGMMTANRERRDLQTRIDEHEKERARIVRDQLLEEERLKVMAEAARERALLQFGRGEYVQSLANFKRSLTMCTEDWEHRERVAANIAALEEWDETFKEPK